MKRIPIEIIKSLCLPGNGKKTCRYLVSFHGYHCVKLEPGLKENMDRKSAKGCLKAKGDNCDGEFKEAV